MIRQLLKVIPAPLKRLVKRVLPAPLIGALRPRGGASTNGTSGSIVYKGNYRSWQEARAASGGYDCAAILEKTCESLLKVKRGEAVYERDTVLFERIEHRYPVVAALLYAASANGGRLRVLDFGGSLGSSYFQSRPYIEQLEDVRWCVVEQPHYVERGKRLFEDGRLCFYDDVAECVRRESPGVALLSSVLPYLEEPLGFLAALGRHRIPVIVIDRNLLLDTAASRLSVQTVPDSIYRASYPCWILRRTEIVGALASDYDLRDEFPAYDGTVVELEDGATARYHGFTFTLRGWRGGRTQQ